MRYSLAKASNLQQRVLASITGGAVFILAIWFNEWTYFILFLTLLVLAMLEFYRLLGTTGYRPNRFIGLSMGIALYVVNFFGWKLASPATDDLYYLIFAIGGILFIAELFRNRPGPFINIAFTLLGVLYIALPFSMLHELAYFQTASYSSQLVLGVFFLIWASDSGAYFIGRQFGRHKLFERISPGKTWEGFVGGFLTAVLLGYALAHLFTDYDLKHWLVMAAGVAIFGALGDLVESMLKRSLEVKDSGNFLPGHGGVLDRFDALLLAVPFVVVLLRFF